MKIWWGFRASQEAFLLFGLTYFFIGGGGFLFNYRKRYLIHKQKRERSTYRNPYFTPVKDRKLKYDQFFNVLPENGKLFIEGNKKL